jgi:hypothetical protein
MKPRQLLKVRDGAGNAIVCHSGSVWVTQEGDPRDIIVSAGESFALDRKGPTLVQALEQSAVSFAQSVRTAYRPNPAKQSGRALAGAVHRAAGA